MTFDRASSELIIWPVSAYTDRIFVVGDNEITVTSIVEFVPELNANRLSGMETYNDRWII
jgi:hypothetical protein